MYAALESTEPESGQRQNAIRKKFGIHALALRIALANSRFELAVLE